MCIMCIHIYVIHFLNNKPEINNRNSGAKFDVYVGTLTLMRQSPQYKVTAIAILTWFI